MGFFFGLFSLEVERFKGVVVEILRNDVFFFFVLLIKFLEKVRRRIGIEFFLFRDIILIL